MAIDQEIQRKVDAYRGNPQQLMQRYQQNQQLVDLLALQKLKSEKEAAAREMQMQMQQQPQTIKQQREAELLGMTKQEMMQQTQGVLQQRQAQQQKNMQQVAQQGLGALANQRPAAPQPAPQGQPMPRMAGGGIVSFQPGGYVGGVTQEEIDAYRASRRGQGSRAIQALSDEEIAQRIVGSRTLADDPNYRLTRRGYRPVSNAPIETADPIERLVDQEPETPDAPQGAMTAIGNGPMSTTAAMQPPRGGVAALLGAQAQPQMSVPEGGIPAIAAEPDAAATPPDAAATPAPEANVAGGGAGGLPGIGGGSAEAAMQRGFQIADEYTGRERQAQRYADMEAELRALDEEMYDPREERRDQLKAFLAGTANTTNFGSTMAGGTLASLNLRRQQRAERRERLQDVFEMAERGMTLDATLAAGGLRLGQQMYADAMANQRAALSAAASLRSAELRAEVRRGELEYNKLKDDRSFGLRERELGIEEARNAALSAQADAENSTRALSAALSGLRYVQEQQEEITQRVAANSQLPALQERLFQAQLGSGWRAAEEVAQLEAAIAAEEARVAVRAEQAFDEMNGVEVRDMLAAQVLELTGTGATMLSMEDIAGIERLDEEE